MGKATELADDLLARPLSPDEMIRRRRAAQMKGDNLVATLDGELVEPAPAPLEQTSRASTSPSPAAKRTSIVSAPLQTWD
jgi:hypothetical protein